MLIKHKIPPAALELRSDPISDEYWAEVETSTAKLEKQHRKAQQALEAIDRRADRIRLRIANRAAKFAARKVKRADEDQLRQIEREQQARESELCEVERLMIPSNYAGRDRKRRVIRMESGTITVPMGALAIDIPSQKPDGGQHILYRHWSHDVLLYVGLTADGGERTSTHARKKRWWLEHEVTNVQVQFYPNRGMLKAAELLAIRTEDPKYNIAGKIAP
jgi:hypothetical protein